jgi:hypothetical protein
MTKELCMRSTRCFWALLAVAAIGCGKGDTPQVVVTDTANRDLQLGPVDSVPSFDDTALPDSGTVTDTALTAPTPRTPVRAPATPKPKPTPSTTRPATASPTTRTAAPTAAVRTLAAGTRIPATTTDSITSATNTVGDVVSFKVAADVSDDDGKVVIPAGATIKARIAAIKWSENKSDKGTLTLEPTSVVIGGTPYDVAGRVANPAFTYKHRGSSLGDAAKPAAGAAAGAAVGGLLGKGTGAVIGGVLGGAVGAQRMVETKDNDIIVAPGSPMSVELTSAFKR